jgi:hypothetical protein
MDPQTKEYFTKLQDIELAIADVIKGIPEVECVGYTISWKAPEEGVDPQALPVGGLIRGDNAQPKYKDLVTQVARMTGLSSTLCDHMHAQMEQRVAAQGKDKQQVDSPERSD